MAEPSKYARLRNTILAMTLCFAILPTLAVGIFIPAQFTSLYRDKALREVENVARSKGLTIDIFFEERIGQLKSLAETMPYEMLTTPGKLSEILQTMKANSQATVDLGIIDMEGRHVAYAGSYDIRDVNYKNEEWFHEVQRRGIYVSDVFMGYRHFPHIIIAVLRDDGKRAWVLRATVDSAVFTSIVQSSRLSNDGDAFVLNREGELQTDSRLSGPIMTRLEMPWPRHEVETSEQDVSGNTRLLSRVKLKNAPWILVVSEDPNIYGSILTRAQVLSGVGILIALAALSFCTWFITRVMIRRLVEADREKAAYDATLLQSNKMAALGKLAAGVAHEVNNPLMLIRETAGWITDMLEDEKPDAMRHYGEISQAAANIERHVGRASGITHRLLGFARRVDPASENLPLNPIISQSIAFLQNEATHRGIELKKDFAEPEPRVATDVGQLQQVLLNIIDNAIDAVGKDGVITVSSKGEGDYAVIQVRDNGPGIPEDKIAQIFDPFFTTKAPGKGTGLGLSICYSIVQGLGGVVKAANHEEGGAVFTILLPLSVPE